MSRSGIACSLAPRRGSRSGSIARSLPNLLPLGLVLFLSVLMLPSGNLAAESALLTKSGTLYEAYPARYGDVVKGAAGSVDARIPVLALRTTLPDGKSSTEVVQGTLNNDEEGAQSVEFDETTHTVFVVYTRFQGLMADVHVAIRRNDSWVEQNIVPSVGLYLSVNPQLLVTRQRFIDFDGSNGNTITKWRSILSLVWWEESGRSQARYAAVFVEDGQLKLDNIVAYNLNQIAGASGSTDIQGLPLSSYQFPALQRDPSSNGGVLVSFANLSNLTQYVLRVTFPDDVTQLVPPGATVAGPQAYARAHIPIGRTLGGGRVPKQIDVNGSVGTMISLSGVPTFYWTEGSNVKFLRGDSEENASPTRIGIRPDFSVDRAIMLLREMSTKE